MELDLSSREKLANKDIEAVIYLNYSSYEKTLIIEYHRY